MYANLKNLNYANWSKTCRFCLSLDNLLVPIFKTGDLVTKINEILNLSITVNDTLPHCICMQCANKIKNTSCTISNIIQSTNKICEYTQFLGIDFIDIDDKSLKPRSNLVVKEASVWKNVECLCYYNWFRICRFCFSLDNVYDLYNTREYAIKVENLTGIKINSSQKLPNKICAECCNQINSADSFVSDSRIAVNKLHKYLELIDLKSEEENYDFVQVKPEPADQPYCDDTCGCVPKSKHGKSKNK